MTNLIGHSLGRYQILEQIGEGGMATVYKAYDTRLGRYVAIKVMLLTAAGSQPDLLRRFEFEARSLAQLSHPSIVRVLDYGEEEGLPFLVLEYIPAGTLKDRIATSPVPWREAAAFLAPIARALEYAHRHGIIHRDVKPSNILITDGGQPMLSDFGIAKALETGPVENTATGIRLGTPEYMSPEQCMAGPVDWRTDMYSLGVVFYEMVTGRKPFTADSPVTVMHRQVYDPLPPPRQFVPGLPEPVVQVLYRALAKNPADRYQTMGELAAMLESLARGPALPTAPVAAVRRSKSSGWNLRLLAGIGAAVLVLLLLGGLFALARPLLAHPASGGSQTAPANGPTATAPAASTSWKQGRLAVIWQQGRTNGLYLLDLTQGGDPRLLFAEQNKPAYGAAWSPGGKEIAYYIYPNDLRVIDPTSGAPSRPAGKCNSPTWSPDGQRILCVPPSGGPFVIVDAASGDPVDVVKNASGATPTWSPAQKEIAYSALSANRKSSVIWRASLDASEPQSLVDTGGENFAPSFSPDGTLIAYQSDEGSSQSEVWVMGRGGENPHRLTQSPPGTWSRGPAWSPDGQWIAYVSNQADSVGADYGEIFVVSLKTGEVVQVTHSGGKVYDWRVSWSN